jgi:3-deoxy-7-phosphoheptulonate synthase
MPLPSPGELRERHPATARAAWTTARARAAIRGALHGSDGERRLVVVVGPCSLHDPTAALEYAKRLSELAEATSDALVIAMRTYLDKPRTTVGWKGLIRDPQLDGSFDLAGGLGLARELLVKIADLGLPCATELLDPLAVPYIADLLSWAAVGARTAESQTHRELASGLDLPVGFKNSMAGSVEVARDAMIAAREPTSYVGLTASGHVGAIRTRGNPDRHVVLRGGPEPNYGPAGVQQALQLVADQGIARPVMVDCSHGNSGKDHRRQAGAFRSVLEQVAAGEERILGLLLESFLKAGRQELRPGAVLEYGVSITDACVGWPETEQLLQEAAAVVRARAQAPLRRGVG